MSALTYLLSRTLKNTVKSLLKKPAALIPYLVVVGLIVFSLVTSLKTESPAEFADIQYFYLVIMLIFGIIFIASLLQGLKQGTAIFKLADVNLLFTAPVRPHKILLYAVTKQAGILIFASVFMVAQYPNFKLNFGLDTNSIVGLIIGYVLVGVGSQLAGIALYAYAAGSAERRAKANRYLRAAGVALVAVVAVRALSGGDILASLVGTFSSDLWNYLPVLGFARATAVYLALGNLPLALLFAALNLGVIGLLLRLLMRNDGDFYEDVLQTTINAAQVADAAKQGRLFRPAGEVSKSVRREGPPLRGRGASALFYRIRRERSRENRFVVDFITAAALFLPLLYSALPAEESGNLWFLFLMGAYILIFLNLKGEVPAEFGHPYLYILPDTSARKLLFMVLPRALAQLLNGAVFGLSCLFFLKVGPLEATAAALVFWSLNGCLFSSAALLSQRLLGRFKSMPVVILLYLLMVVLLIAPGAVGAILLVPVDLLAYLAFAGYILAVSLLILLLSRNLVHNMDVG